MRALNLVTNPESRFYQQQVRALEGLGVSATTLGVPAEREYGDDEIGSRSVVDYLRLVPPTLRESRGPYDLLHANFGLTAPPAVLQRDLPVVLSLWGTDLMGEYGWLSKLCARAADAVVVMSEEMAVELGQECHVIPHGVDLDRFAPTSTADAKADLGWDADAHQVLFPYPPARGVKDYPRAERVVAAVGDRLDADVRLHAVDGVPHARMATYYNAADALLLTSKREGSPNAVKEAMACNCPVVATDVGDVRARLDGVAHSHVCVDDDALVDSLSAVLAAGERSDGRAAAREVSVDRTSRELHEVYRSVVADGGS